MAITPGGNRVEQKVDQMMGSSCTCGQCNGYHGHRFGKKIIMTFVGILLVYTVFYLGTLIRKNMKEYNYIGKADRMERSVTINGFGKVTGNNDIAVTSIGFSNTNKDVAQAQMDNNKVMDQVYAELKTLGVAEKDLESNYTIYPDYNYTQDKGQELKGYRVSNSVTVKIRDLSKIGSVLALAGKYGATEVGGLSFTIDDPENLKVEARDKALADARAKALDLARTLGVRLGSVISYYENEAQGGEYYPVMYDKVSNMSASVAPAPITSGSKDVSMNVSIVYEILQ
jgi:uncharacterized protein YggE